ncbi:hypothetical protein FHS07_002535 [Microbacterium proteolyticum]|uniref:Adhesin domain-containing protein n=1 Tax=Microbacterium proteolyticum TaxID=1572644 RepID=A0A7W5GH01_9MICO|nr:hypothetical protein [Microbacterium proteolyticum]MBB3158817.1 hypothetical protein [Microbacterium proteolyticum]
MTSQTTLPTPVAPEPPRRRGAAFVVSVMTIVVGSCVALATLAGTGVSAVARMADWRGDTSSYEVPPDSSASSLTDLEIDLAGGELTVEYGDVESAQLDADGRGPQGWTFDQVGDSLRVASPSGSFVDAGRGPRATLILPWELDGSGITADIRVTGGALELTGGFGDVTVEVAGGVATLDGAARDIDVTVTGGSAMAAIMDAEAAAFEVAGGELTATLSGVAPTRTDVEVTAGSADITLPDDEYRVRVDDGLGAVDNGLRTSSSATATVDVTATMGSVRLRS